MSENGRQAALRLAGGALGTFGADASEIKSRIRFAAEFIRLERWNVESAGAAERRRLLEAHEGFGE